MAAPAAAAQEALAPEKSSKASKDSIDADEEKAMSMDNEENTMSRDNEAELGQQPPADTDAAPPAQSAGPGPPPDGGLTAWLQVLGGFMLFFNTYGLLNTFGVYQTYYESGQRWSASSSDISWIGSIQAYMVLLVGLFSGPIYDRGHLRILLLIGTFFVVFGHMMLSLTHNFWEALLAQGFCIGLGAGCLFVPSVAIMPTYFSKRLGTAIGLAAAGSSTGGIIYPIMFYKLIGEVGYPWAVRILGFTVLATLLIPIAVMRMRVKPGRIRSLIDWSALTDGPWMLFVLSTLIGFIGLYVGIFYTSYYSQATGLTDASLSFYLVPILNAGSVFGRTVPNIISDKIGALNVVAPGAVLVGVVLLCYIAVSSVGGIVVVTLLFGFFSGIFIAMPPVVLVLLTADKSKIGTRIGMGFAIAGLGALIGGPGGGGVLGNDPKNLHWTAVWVFGGVCTLAAGILFIVLRFIKVGPKLMVKI